MAPLVHLIRHAQAVHNAEHDPTTTDPGLTILGRQESEKLAAAGIIKDMADAGKRTRVVSSPSRRCIETALIALQPMLEMNNGRQQHCWYSCDDDGDGGGDDRTVKTFLRSLGPGPILLSADFMETDGSLICNRPSDIKTISKSYDSSKVNIAWLRKQGDYVNRAHPETGLDYSDDAIHLRTARARKFLRELAEVDDDGEIAVVSHGAYLLKLVDGEKPWSNAEIRTFRFASWPEWEENDTVTLVRVSDTNAEACQKSASDSQGWYSRHKREE